jgi:uncharacterized membrane protein YdjX (TVP38/TMEM64 family)
MEHIKLAQRGSDTGVDAVQIDATIPLEHHIFPDGTERKRCSASKVLKIIVGLILTGLIVFVLYDTMTKGSDERIIQPMLTWCEKNPLEGTVIYVICFIVGVLLMIPATIFVVASGFIFSHVYGFGGGVAVAIFISLLGTTCGSTLAFLLGRYLFKECLAPKLQNYRMLKVLDKAMDEHGFRVMVLLHLNPVTPFSILNYLAGSLSIKVRDYSFASVGTTPGVILYCFLGASAQNISALEDAEKDKTATISTIVVGLVAGVSLVKFMASYARKELEVLEAQYALEEDGAEENVRPSTVVSTDEMDDIHNLEVERQIEVVEQKSQDEDDRPSIV